MNKQEELKLFEKYKQTGNPEYKQQLIRSLKPIIVKHVEKYTNSGLPKPALELESYNLVSKAIDTYDPKKAQLNTHVYNNLKKLSRFVTSYQNIGHIPEHRALLIGQYQIIVSNLKDQLGREPTSAEIADAMNVSIKEVERLQEELRKDLLISDIAEEEDEIGFYNFINPIDETSKYKEALEIVYFDANPTEKRILEGLTGIYGKPKKTSQQLMMELHLTQQEFTKIKKKLAEKINELL
jgi:RNA polymerase primary sigma factor